MRFPISTFIQRIAAVACLVLFWGTSAQAQIIFETQFAKGAEQKIGETEKNLSGEDVAGLLMESTRIQMKGSKEAAEGYLFIVFFGEEGERLHTIASGPVKLALEPPLVQIADVMPGDRVVEGFERTLGEYGFRMNDVGTLEPPPIMGAPENRAGGWEPPPIMMDSGEANPEIQKMLWSEVREPGVGVAFVPVLGRYSEGDAEVRIRPAMITGVLGN